MPTETMPSRDNRHFHSIRFACGHRRRVMLRGSDESQQEQAVRRARETCPRCHAAEQRERDLTIVVPAIAAQSFSLFRGETTPPPALASMTRPDGWGSAFSIFK